MVAQTSSGEADGCVTPVDHAFDQLVTGLDHLIKVVEDGGLDHYDDDRLLGFHQAYESLRARMPVVEHQVILEEERRGLPERRTPRMDPTPLARPTQQPLVNTRIQARAANTRSLINLTRRN